MINDSNESLEKRRRLIDRYKNPTSNNSYNNDDNTKSSNGNSNKSNNTIQETHGLMDLSTTMESEKGTLRQLDSSSLSAAAALSISVSSLNKGHKANDLLNQPSSSIASSSLHDDDYLVNKSFNHHRQPKIINDTYEIFSNQEEADNGYHEEYILDPEKMAEKTAEKSKGNKIKKEKRYRKPVPIQKFNAYMLFDNENRKRIMQERRMESSGKLGNICKVIAQEYKALSEVNNNNHDNNNATIYIYNNQCTHIMAY